MYPGNNWPLSVYYAGSRKRSREEARMMAWSRTPKYHNNMTLLVKQIGALTSGHYYFEQTTAMFGKIIG